MPVLKFDPSKVKQTPPASVIPQGFSLVGQTEQSREAVQVPISLLDPYTDPEGNGQPFLVCDDDAMEQMVESVMQRGIITPLTLRPKKNGRYEILAGHRRKKAAERCGLMTVPAVIRQCDDDEAALILVDTNLQQRQKLLPSEKAKAYRIKMDALNRKGQRSDLLGEGPYDAAAQVAEEASASKRSVFQYLRLNELSEPLLAKVDASKISLVAGVDLSYLSVSQQEQVEQVMKTEELEKITPSQARELREAAALNNLTAHTAKEVLGCCLRVKKPLYLNLRLSVDGLITGSDLKRLKDALRKAQDNESFVKKLLDYLRQIT